MDYSRHQLQDTITALATPPGLGAIGIIRLSGPAAVSIVAGLFRGKKLAAQPSHTAHVGRIIDAQGEVLDEVVVTLFLAPRSYTGEDVVEISCHGSPYILQKMLELLQHHGARLAQPGEFTMRAFLRGKLDLSQAEAVADLIAAGSEAAHRQAMLQMRGGYSNRLKALRQKLIDFASLIELELDFGEEDVEFAKRDDLKLLVAELRQLLRELVSSFQLGNAIKEGVATVIAGRPNAGKSTLLNALLNEDRAIVSDVAGTTRDVIEEVLNIQGVPFRIIDTAGIRDAQDTIEAMGVARTMEKIRQSAVLVYVFDVVRTSPAEVAADLAQLVPAGVPLLVVANKMDLNPYTTWEQYALPGSAVTADNWLPVSARNAMNIEYCKERLLSMVVSGEVSLESTLVTNARHHGALVSVLSSLEAVDAGLSSGITGDLLAMDLRAALFGLGEITGEVSTDELLGNIFGRFCIGK